MNSTPTEEKDIFTPEPLKKTLIVSHRQYWTELGTMTNIEPQVCSALQCAVHAYITNTIPQETNSNTLQKLKEYPIREIQIVASDDQGYGSTETLSILAFIPDNPQTHRQFIYLTRRYPNGKNIPLEEAPTQ